MGRGCPGSGWRPAERSAVCQADSPRSVPRSKGRLQASARGACRGPARPVRCRCMARCPARRARRCLCGAARCTRSAAWAASWGPSASTRPCWPSWQARPRGSPRRPWRPGRAVPLPPHPSGLLAARVRQALRSPAARTAPRRLAWRAWAQRVARAAAIRSAGVAAPQTRAWLEQGVGCLTPTLYTHTPSACAQACRTAACAGSRAA